MSGSSQPLEPSLKRGRTFLCGALVILGVLLVHGLRKGPDRGEMDVLTGFVHFGFYAVVMILAFRGGRLSLALLKGCAGLFALMCAVLIIVAAAAMARGQPLPESPGVRNTGEFLAVIAGVAFCVWALFFSRDVQGFLASQCANAHARSLRAVRPPRSDQFPET